MTTGGGVLALRRDVVSPWLFDLCGEDGFDLSTFPTVDLPVIRSRQAPTFSRASIGTAFDSSGYMRTNVHSVPRRNIGSGRVGYLFENTRTNNFLYARDLTNAAWGKTNITAAKDQTGIDGVANSASSITATAANGYIQQSIVLASSLRRGSAYVKRITGSGVVRMWDDYAAAWTAITVTSDWTRVTVPGVTIANPTMGFQLATNGDAIAVDVVQNEAGGAGVYGFESSPIPTTSATVQRVAESLTFTGGWAVRDLTYYVELLRPSWVDFGPGSLGEAFLLCHGAPTIGASLALLCDDATRTFRVRAVDGAVATTSASGAMPAGAILSVAAQFRNLTTDPQVRIDVNDGSGFGAWSAGGTIAAFSSLVSTSFKVGGSTVVATKAASATILRARVGAGLVERAAIAR